jgi:DNA-binding transcriptional LysR family regulator
MSTRDQIEALRQGDIDVGFLRMGASVPGLHVTPVLRDELKIACHQDLARTRRLTPAVLFQQPLVLVSRATSPTFHDHVLATCRQAGYSPSIVQEANQLLTALLLVQAGAGLSLVPASCGGLGLPGVRILEGPLPQAHWKIGLACPRSIQTAPAIQRFRAIVKSHLR